MVIKCILYIYISSCTASFPQRTLGLGIEKAPDDERLRTSLRSFKVPEISIDSILNNCTNQQVATTSGCYQIQRKTRGPTQSEFFFHQCHDHQSINPGNDKIRAHRELPSTSCTTGWRSLRASWPLYTRACLITCAWKRDHS